MTFIPQNVCSQKIDFDLVDGRIYNLVFTSGCNGNLGGIAKLLEGVRAEEAVSKLQGLRCGSRPTSCPDQLATALNAALKQHGQG